MGKKSILKIRKSKEEDIKSILEIFESAKEFMRKNGNYSQWGENYPGEQDILNDISKGNSYVGCDMEEEIVMTFAFILGNDPTYTNINVSSI